VAAALAACGDRPHRLEGLFPGPSAAAEEVEALAEMPAGLRVLPDGRWAVSLADPEPEPAPYQLDRDVLLVPVAGGRFEARVEDVRREGGGPRVAWGAGVLAAAVRRGAMQPGTAVIAVRLRDGWTRTVAAWDMDEDDGYLDVEAMRLSPDGRWLACQVVEHHPARRGEFREAGRRGLVIPLGEAAGGPVDLGPGVAGPMAWTPDGALVYFLRPRPRGGAALARAALPAGAAAPPRAARPLPSDEPQPQGPAGAEPPPAAFTEADLIAQIIRLSSPDPSARLAAAAAIETMPDDMAVGPLLTAMDAGDPALCRAAGRALRAILTRPDAPALGAADAASCRMASESWRAFWSAHPDAIRR
jgi:hypothetical protein